MHLNLIILYNEKYIVSKFEVFKSKYETINAYDRHNITMFIKFSSPCIQYKVTNIISTPVEFKLLTLYSMTFTYRRRHID